MAAQPSAVPLHFLTLVQGGNEKFLDGVPEFSFNRADCSGGYGLSARRLDLPPVRSRSGPPHIGPPVSRRRAEPCTTSDRSLGPEFVRATQQLESPRQRHDYAFGRGVGRGDEGI